MNNQNLKDKFPGRFIVLDGPDGSGKSTQTKLLAEWLVQNGVEVAAFRDPGGTAIGEKIRHILLNPEHIAMSARSEALLYMAARAQLWEEKIKPALQSNKCAVLDRWLSSSCAYQGYAGGLGIENVITVAQNSLEKVWPDITVILDVDLQTSRKRLSGEPDRMEQKDDEYHKKVREGFLQLAKCEKHFVIVDAADDIETVHKMVIESVKYSTA